MPTQGWIAHWLHGFGLALGKLGTTRKQHKSSLERTKRHRSWARRARKTRRSRKPL